MIEQFEHMNILLYWLTFIFTHLNISKCNEENSDNDLGFYSIRNVLSEWKCDGLVIASGSYCDLLTGFCIAEGNLALKEILDSQLSTSSDTPISSICGFIDHLARKCLFDELSVLGTGLDQINVFSLLFISVIYQEIANIELSVKNSKLTVLIKTKRGKKFSYECSILINPSTDLVFLFTFTNFINRTKEGTKYQLSKTTLLTPEWTMATLLYYYLPTKKFYNRFLTSTYEFCCRIELPMFKLFACSRDPLPNCYWDILDNMVSLINDTPEITKVVPCLENAEFIPSEHAYSGLNAMTHILNIFADCKPQDLNENKHRLERISTFLENKKITDLKMVYEQILYFLQCYCRENIGLAEMHKIIVFSLNNNKYKLFDILNFQKSRLRVNNRVALQIFDESNIIKADIIGECEALNNLDENPAEYNELKEILFVQGKRLEYLIMRFATEYTYIPTGVATINN